ncbi:hypothetical protein FIBSPDRAFT_1043891 [Athelia psychrophila]|uniref:Uncharacterized protein n=1 Tax=Athelia psychrophila TaxID=1759441 RepID=A0A166KJ75_9AGAM|nr:hypothetical protein FIBSPDRAFT_1043891 [Fibularhizoctonia sp. CBS 109695]
MNISPKRVRLILTSEKNRVGRRNSTNTSDTAIECLKELDELKNLQIQTLIQEVSEFQERAAQWEQEKAKLLGEILSLERKIESLEQDLEQELTASAITANGRDAENKTLAKEVASLNEIVQAKCQMLDVWASLGARWDNDKAALEHRVRSSESEIQRLSTSPGAQAIPDVTATPIDPEEPGFLKASLPVPPRPETAIATARLPAPPRLSLLQRTRLTSNLETTSKSPDAIFSSQAISPTSSTQTTEALSDSTPKFLNDTHTETGLEEASSLDCDRDTMNPDAVHAHAIQLQNHAIETDVGFNIDSMVGVSFSSPDLQVSLERGFVAVPSGSAASGNIQHPPGAKRGGRPKGSRNKKDVDLDLDFLDDSFSSSSSDVAFDSQLGEDLNLSAPSASAAASGNIQPSVSKRIGRPKGSKNKNKADKELPVFGPARKRGRPLRFRHSPAPISASVAANETQKRRPGRPRKYPLMAPGPEFTNVANSQGPLPAPTTYSVPPLYPSSATSSTHSWSAPTLSLDTLVVPPGPNALDAANVALIPTDGTLKRKRGRPRNNHLPLMTPGSEPTDVASSQGPLPAPTTVSVPLLHTSSASFPTPTLTLDAPLVPPAAETATTLPVYMEISWMPVQQAETLYANITPLA